MPADPLQAAGGDQCTGAGWQPVSPLVRQHDVRQLETAALRQRCAKSQRRWQHGAAEHESGTMP